MGVCVGGGVLILRPPPRSDTDLIITTTTFIPAISSSENNLGSGKSQKQKNKRNHITAVKYLKCKWVLLLFLFCPGDFEHTSRLMCPTHLRK